MGYCNSLDDVEYAGDVFCSLTDLRRLARLLNRG